MYISLTLKKILQKWGRMKYFHCEIANERIFISVIIKSNDNTLEKRCGEMGSMGDV